VPIRPVVRPAARVLARLALVACVPAALAAQAPAAPATRSPHERLAREIYEELVEINTADSVGSVTRAVEAMARRFRAAGFPAADVQVLVPAGKPTKGNLVVRYRGTGQRKPILLLAHLDVVAARREDWPRDPFTLHEENGYFLGRGTADDKAMAAMFMANVLRYKREGFRPDRDLIVALTADEEGGDANGVEFLLERHAKAIEAAYALNEGGGGVLGADGRPLFHSVQAAEKVPVNLTLAVANTGGHSSVPRPDNAIYQLAAALQKVAAFRFPVALNQVSRPYFAEMAKVRSGELAAMMRRLAEDPTDSVAAAFLSQEPNLASIMRTSCVATRLDGGHAYNALPQMAKANINCRVVPSSNVEEVVATLARVIGDTAVTITPTIPIREKFGAAPSAIDAEVLGAVTDLTRRTWGDIPIVPSMSTGATDGRFLRAAGIATYGVSGIFSLPGENNAHGRDEKLRVRSFYEGLAFLDALVRRLSGGTPRT
jgi:acetylornithine deacetylase/succinyl-diaminopimelate desuccinylase-like protein